MYEGKAWCKTHPLGRIDKDRAGRWFRQCTYGYKLYQKCDLRREDDSPLFGGGEKKTSSDND